MSKYLKYESVRCSVEPHSCAFGCGTFLRTKYDRNVIEGWMWFCGYGDEVFHFCPHCVARQPHAIETLRERLNVKPDGYPEKKHSTAELFAAICPDALSTTRTK